MTVGVPPLDTFMTTKWLCSKANFSWWTNCVADGRKRMPWFDPLLTTRWSQRGTSQRTRGLGGGQSRTIHGSWITEEIRIQREEAREPYMKVTSCQTKWMRFSATLVFFSGKQKSPTFLDHQRMFSEPEIIGDKRTKNRILGARTKKAKKGVDRGILDRKKGGVFAFLDVFSPESPTDASS